MNEKDWHMGAEQSVAIFLNGKGINSVDAKGNKIIDINFYMIYNSSAEQINYRLPEPSYSNSWVLVLDTTLLVDRSQNYPAASTVLVGGRSVMLLKQEIE